MNEQNPKSNWNKKILLIIFLLIIIISGNYIWQHFSKEILLFVSKIRTTIISTPVQNNMQKEIPKEVLAKDANWKPIAIEQLVRMADLTLNTTGNVKTALAFLLTAKKYADDFNEPTITRILDKDIIRLQAVPTIAFEELVIKIDMISQQINNLPTTPSTTTVVAPKEAADANLLKRFFTSAITALKDIVIIRHHAIEPMPLPDQMTILRFNIQNKLLQAELAVMQKQNKIYQMCLAQVIDLITKYFTANKTVPTNILQTLKELQQVNLQPELPQLSELLMAVQKFTKT